MNFKDQQQTKNSNKWLKRHGVNVAHIYVGTTELFQATMLATVTLKQCGPLLTKDQANKFNKFLQAAGNTKLRQRITQAQCYQVMNTAKQLKRLSAKQDKANK
jgi:hypothetical protein